MGSKLKKIASRVAYLQRPGRENVSDVVQEIKLFLKRRRELRNLKVVVFTAHGEGALVAHTKLIDFAPKIIAVTFPKTFTVKRDDGWYTPTINTEMRQYFDQAGISILTPQSLPFDLIAGMEGHNQCMRQARDTIAIFGAGFTMCVQAVLRACDDGLIEHGEFVIAFSADTAALIKASPTSCLLSSGNSLEVAEIICKPRAENLPLPASAGLLIEARHL